MQFTPPIVDLRSKKSMLDYLKGHFRYDTMSSFNQSTTFAHNVKIPRLGLKTDPRIVELDKKHGLNTSEDTAYELLEMDGLHDRIMRKPLASFHEKVGYQYTICQNGRSGGYLTMLHCSREQSEYKSRCASCGQRNYQLATPQNNKCGVCGKTGEEGRHNYEPALMQLSIRPGLSVGEDLDDMETYQLKRLATEVREFDLACIAIRENFINVILNNQVKETTVLVPEQRRVLTPRTQPVAG